MDIARDPFLPFQAKTPARIAHLHAHQSKRPHAV
jgi:hypothetical protein